MRTLNKIVFINSAHIRLAEVEMDGNVHFIGSQGVGKTTLLRALLFFYNCRKDKLGIRTQGQQTFDDFYIPNTSSYIIYEVSRGVEERPFSIILFRHNNRAAFRFVDAPYSRDWFIDSLGMVASDHVTVWQRIQSLGIDYSNIIEKYTQYLDILYGNRSAHLSRDLLKYYLLKSQKYQNIPRIIQNVFLNERVDAGFIKNIIINSISQEDEEIAVDLNFFRSKLIHFSEELKDISLWNDKNHHGIIETRRDADIIIGISHDIKAARFSMREQCGMLNFAMDKAERDIPLLQSRIDKRTGTINLINDKIKKIYSDFEREHKKIIEDIAVLSSKINEAAKLKKEYQRIGINEMIVRANKLPGLNLELKQKENLLSQLISGHQSIADKYRLLRDRINLDKQQYLQTLKENKNNADSDFNNRQIERLKRKDRLETNIRNKFKEQLEVVEEHLGSYRELLQEQKVQRVKTSSSSPMKDELAACEQNIAELVKKIQKLTEKKLKEENNLNIVRNNFQTTCQQIELDTTLLIKDIEGRINQLETQRKEEQQILDNAHGSLCEWLDNNLDGWEKSIGKIVDEKDVLYSQNLSPHLTDDKTETIFGVSIDLDSIEKEVRTPSMIKDAISILDSEIQTLANDIIKLREEKDLRIKEVGKEIRTQQKSIQDEIDTINQNIQVYEQQKKQESLRLISIKEAEKSHIEEIIATFDERIQELQFKVNNFLKERSDINDRCENELRRINKTISDEAKTDKSQIDALKRSIDNEVAKYSTNYNVRIKKLDMDEDAELSASGVDTGMLETVRNELAAIKSSINLIDKERDKIAEYRKDCRELLDCVTDLQFRKSKLETSKTSLQSRYEERRNKYELKRHEEEKALSALQTLYNKAKNSKQKADEFIVSNACPAELKETVAIPTELDANTIISTITTLIIDISRLSNTLKEDTNQFRKRFSINNTFKFPTVFDTIDDYHRYADSLEDFIANNKIKDFQQVTSNLYRDILSRAASDFNILLGRESDIVKIIKDINYDFDKKTFAGVIRSIELRLDRSTMPIITHLQNITDFWQSHQYELGEINLFSSDEHSDINREAIKYLKSLSAALNNASDLKKLPLDQTFALKFKITENDNTTDWVENIRAIGSEGTDILVKAIINILLISVFKKRAGQAGDFRLHCMMDEIGRLADENIQGILNFANQRGILIVNSSPKAHRPLSYRRLYMLSKDSETNTIIMPILSTREVEML